MSSQLSACDKIGTTNIGENETQGGKISKKVHGNEEFSEVSKHKPRDGVFLNCGLNSKKQHRLHEKNSMSLMSFDFKV